MSFDNKVSQNTVQGFITLYELDARRLGGEIYRFHGHNDGAITWQGNEYQPISIKADGLEMRSDGKASSPTLVIHNDIGGVAGALRVLCLRFGDFAGARLKVIHTLAEYLNSPSRESDEQNYKVQYWYIEQKTAETNATTTFELSNPVDFEGLKIPVRQITNYCHWAVCGRYRGEECAYLGTAMFVDGKPTDDPALDSCTGSLHECQVRDNVDSFGGFPASSLIG